MRTATTLIALFVGVTFLSGCASVTGTRNQPVSVRSSCGAAPIAGAACKLSNDKGEWHVASTPGSVTIQKAFGDVAVECEKTGFGRGARIYQSAANASIYGNILVGGLIGYAIDAGSGSGFDYPQLMSVDVCNGVTRSDVAPAVAQSAAQSAAYSPTVAPLVPTRQFRPASCDWPGVKQGIGAC